MEEEEETFQLANDHIDSQLEFCDICAGISSQIPQTCVSPFLRRQEIVFNCIDANENLVAIGTSVGSLFLYIRKLKKISKFGGPFKAISCVKCYSCDYDYIAAGHQSGDIILVRLPSSEMGQSRKLGQHRLTEIHGHEIRSLEWSPDGTKLFSGDASGLVMMTLINTESAVFHSSFVCCEDCPIVQLSYGQSLLAVSTVNRAILVDLVDQCTVTQVGSKKRKTAGNYGIKFLSISCEDGKTKEYSTFVTSRPGFRLWSCDRSGDVIQTLLYKDLIENAPTIPVPISLAKESTPTDDKLECVDFGQLQQLNETQIVTYGLTQLFVINPKYQEIVAKLDLGDKNSCIRDLAVCQNLNEIYLLLGDRTLLRLGSNSPDPEIVFTKKDVNKGAKTRVTSLIENLSPKRIPSKDEVVTKIRTSVSSSNQQMVESLREVERYFNTKSSDSVDLTNDTQSTTSSKKFVIISTDQQSLFDDLENNAISEPDSVVTVTSIPLQVKHKDTKSSETSWKDTLMTSFVDSVGGFGANVETGDFDKASLPYVTPTESPVRTSDSVVVMRKKKNKKPKKVRNSAGSNSGNSQLSTNSNEGPPSSDSGSTEGVEYRIPEVGMSREDLEQMLDNIIIEKESEKKKMLFSVPSISIEDENDEPKTLTFENEEPKIYENDDPNTLTYQNDDEMLVIDNYPIPMSTPEKSEDFNAILEQELPYEKQIDNCSPSTSFSPDILCPIPVDDESNDQLLITNDPNSIGSDTAFFTTQLIKSNTQQLDIWSKLDVSSRVLNVSGCSNYIIYVDASGVIHYGTLGGAEIVWDSIEQQAEAVAIGANGRLIWCLFGGTIYALIRPHSMALRGHKWVEAAKHDIIGITLNSDTGWYLRSDGEVCVQLSLTCDRPCYRVHVVECDYRLLQITCCDQAVWGLKDDGKLVIRIGITKVNQIGDDWVDVIPHGPSDIVSICLYGDTGWVVDVSGHVWFTDGITYKYPFGKTARWWQVTASTTTSERGQRTSLLNPYMVLPQVCCNAAGLFIAAGNTIQMTRSSISGHRWKHAIPPRIQNLDQFTRISVGSLFDYHTDCVWVLRPNGEMFCYRAKNLSSLPPIPNNAKPYNISSSLGTLWVVDTVGKIYIRSGIDPQHCPIGLDWQILDMTQLDDVNICSIGCGLDVVWSVDNIGGIWVRIGTGINGQGGLPSAWAYIDSPLLLNNKDYIRKVYTGADGGLVWVLSKNGRVFARFGITESLPVGEHWTEVEGLQCFRLGVGSEVVWALDLNGKLWRRHGVNGENTSGNYWKPVPGNLRFIDVTPNNRLWGLDGKSRLVRHQVKIYKPDTIYEQNSELENIKLTDADEFEML